MRLRNVWVHALGLAIAVTVTACGGGPEAPKPIGSAAGPAAAAAGAQKIDPATVGDVKGVVSLNGTAPKNEPIRMNADPVCLKEAKGPQFQETYAVGADGKSLGNVFVYVKDGLGNYLYDAPTPVDAQPAGMPLHTRTCSAFASVSRSRSSTAIRRSTTSTRCRRRTRSSTTASRFRA